MNRLIRKKKTRTQRKFHVRKKVVGSAEKPRLTIYKSNRHLIAQAIDDANAVTLAAISTHEKDFKALGNTIAAAEKLGAELGARLKKSKVTTLVFDRNGYKYHGVVKAFADSVRAGGIAF